ncbi:hypothetical protein ACXWHK_004678 [Vibrio alginolyticus]
MNRTFPDQLKKLHSIEIDYADGEGIDFEPYDDFYSQEETSEWIKAWTGNSSLNGHEYLIFGQDGSGGYAAFWLVANVEDLLQQPIVFFGSKVKLGWLHKILETMFGCLHMVLGHTRLLLIQI